MVPWNHSIVKGNLNKKKKTKTETKDQSMKAYKLANKTKNKITPFGTHFTKFVKTVSYEVNLTSQCSHREALLVRKGIFDFLYNDV